MKKCIVLSVALLLHAAARASVQQTAPKNITFSTAARAVGGSAPALYVGASPATRFLGSDKKILTHKLTRISKGSGGNVLQPFAPTKVKLDGADGDHPLNNATVAIAQMATLDDQFPIFATAKYDNSGKAPELDGLFLVTDDKDGASLVKADAVNDHEGNPVKAPPAALTAGKKYVFAVVGKGDAQFDDPVEDKRGIAVFEYAAPEAPAEGSDDAAAASSDKKLKQINAPNYAEATGKALAIDLSAKVSPVVAFGDGTVNGIDHALVGRAASAVWDEGLERLYVGFNAMRCDAATKPGGVVGVCMAYPTYKADGTLSKFEINPIVDSVGRGHFYSLLPQTIYENSTPANAYGAYGALVGVVTGGLGGNFHGLVHNNAVGGADFTASGFSVSIADLNVCAKILQAAVKYCRENAAGPADALLTYLRGPAGGIEFAGRVNSFFLPDWANFGSGAANDTVIFGDRYTDAGHAGGNDVQLRDAIRARFVQLLANAKIVNKAYAMGNFANSTYTNSLDFIIGYYADGKNLRLDAATGVVQARNDGDDDLAVSIPRLAVMNTSTGRPYLIVHSIMSTSPVVVGNSLYTEADNWIYALPLIPKGPNNPAYLQGAIAAVDPLTGKIEFAVGPGIEPGTTYKAPGDLTNMPKRFQRAVRVGGGNPVPASWVQDMFVAGDSVYITLAGVQAGQQGMFKSTAIFDGDGCIIDWTPATRVMGQVAQTFAGMVDPKSANVYALTQTTPGTPGNSGPTTAQVTQWGKGTAAMHGGSVDFSLDAVLGKLFDAKKGGVHGVLSFDELTYGFPKKQLSMLMAYGLDGVALVQTGRRKGRAFVPNTKHSVVQDVAKDIYRTVFHFNDAAVSAVGPITCGAVVHCPPVHPQVGWTKFYVGGYRGLAMLNVNYPDPATFMTNLNVAAVGAPAGFGGHGVPGVLPGDSVVAVGQAVTRNVDGTINTSHLHVLTNRGVVVNTIPAAPGVFVGPGALVASANAIDGHVLASGTIVAAPTGLTFVPAAGVNPVALACPAGVTPLQIQVISARNADGLFELPATVYMLGMGPRMPDDVADAAAVGSTSVATDQVVQLWRVGVWTNAAGAVVAPGAGGTSNIIDAYKNHPTRKVQPRPYAQYPDLRLNFSVDGTVWFDTASRDGGNADFMRAAAMTKPRDALNGFVDLQTSLVEQMDIDRDGSFKIGVPVRDTSTGAWLVPGDWGLRVNE